MDTTKDYKERLPNKEEINESFNRYFGFLHTKINILADMDYSKIIELSEKGWNLEISKKEMEKLINDFVNIYGYIYKEGDSRGAKRLMRGTTTQEAQQLHEGKEISKILSTTTDEQIAKQFCEYGKAALIRIETEPNLPYIYAEDLKDGSSKNEKELLILPFSKVTRAQYTSNWQGYKYYDVTLQKGELPDISDEKIDELKKFCINNYDEFTNQLEQYKRLHGDYSKFREVMPILSKMNEYRDNMQKLLKGLCRQREKDIDLQIQEEKAQIEEIRNKRKEESRKKEEKRLEKLVDEVQQLRKIIDKNNTSIQENTEANLESFIKTIRRYRNMANILGINTFNTQNIEQQLQYKMRKIVESTRERYVSNEIDEEYKLLSSKIPKYNEVEYLLGELPEIRKSYDDNSWIDLKKNLNDKVQGMIYRATLNKLNEQKQITSSQKDNFINKILGKTQLKNARMEYIKEKMEYAQKQMQITNPSNSVKEMLANMYEFAYNYNGGVLPPEMAQMEKSIRKVFSNIPDQDTLNKIALSKQKSELPIKTKKRLFSWIRNRQEARRIKEETIKINAESRSIKLMARQNTNTKLINLYGKYNQIVEKVGQVVNIQENQKDRQVGER